MFEKILGSVTNEIMVSNPMNNEVMAPYLKQIKALQEMKGIQATNDRGIHYLLNTNGDLFTSNSQLTIPFLKISK